MKTRSQTYAESAYRLVSRFTDGDKKKYGSMAHKLPTLIRTAGLAQALEFVKSRGTDEQKMLLNHLAETVGFQTSEELLKRSREASLPEYIILTRKVLDALVWYRRFAESVLGVEAGDEGGNDQN